MTDVPMCFLRRQVTYRRHPFGLEAAEQSLHRGVVPAISAAAHALLYSIAPQALTELPAALARRTGDA
jgi:hypothetical protein